MRLDEGRSDDDLSPGATFKRQRKDRGVVCWMVWDGAYWRSRRLRSAKGLTKAHGGQPWRVAKERAGG